MYIPCNEKGQVVCFTVFYRWDRVSKMRSKIFRTLEEAKAFADEVTAKGYTVTRMMDYVGKRIAY